MSPADPREEKLPAWTRKLLGELRSEISFLNDEVQALELVNQNLAQTIENPDALVTAVLSSNDRIPLPDDVIIEVRAGSTTLDLTLAPDRGAVLVEAGHKLVPAAVPVSSMQLRIQAVQA